MKTLWQWHFRMKPQQEMEMVVLQQKLLQLV